MSTVEELEKQLADSKAKAEENIKGLQKKLSEKDLAVKNALEEIEEFKKKGLGNKEETQKIDDLNKKIENLTGQIGNIEKEKRKEELQKKFPDILPELLIGKSDEEAEIIVKKQREIIQKNYDEKPSAHEPRYTNASDFDKEAEKIKQDKTLDTDQKLVKIRELKLKRNF